jgi:hypothetical protein
MSDALEHYNKTDSVSSSQEYEMDITKTLHASSFKTAYFNVTAKV